MSTKSSLTPHWPDRTLTCTKSNAAMGLSGRSAVNGRERWWRARTRRDGSRESSHRCAMAGRVPGNRSSPKSNVQAAIKQYRELNATQQDAYDFSEPQLNGLGYQLLQMKRVKDAIEILKLNVEMFPQGFNTYDSLGEAYMENGDKQLAIQDYKKSLELNPKNTGAV
ncbi:MAG: tetratricopeptide repeat protein [Acidobacteriota bacterium]